MINPSQMPVCAFCATMRSVPDLGTAARAKVAAGYDAEKIQDRIANLMLAQETKR